MLDSNALVGIAVVLLVLATMLSVAVKAFRVAPVELPLSAPTPSPIFLRHVALRQAEHRCRMERLSQRRRAENPEILKLKTENQRLQNLLHDITAGQAKGIDLFLEAERTKKPLTRTAVTLLLGKDKTTGLQMIRNREPVPDEIARPEPVPV